MNLEVLVILGAFACVVVMHIVLWVTIIIRDLFDSRRHGLSWPGDEHERKDDDDERT